MMMIFGLFQVYFVLVGTGVTLAAFQNVTIDDYPNSSSFMVYLPNASIWNQGNECPGCYLQLDPSQTYDGTWHGTTYNPTGTFVQGFNFTFTGNGLYIFFVLANHVVNATTYTNVNFVLDDVQVSTFTHNPSTSTNFVYNQLVYANDSIPYGQHTMHVAPVDDGTSFVLILFDYLIYTMDNDTSSNTSVLASSSLTTNSITTASGIVQSIIGCVIGRTTAIVAVILSLFCCQRHKKCANDQSSLEERNMAVPFGILVSSEDALQSGQPPTGSILSKRWEAAVVPAIAVPSPSATITSTSTTAFVSSTTGQLLSSEFYPSSGSVLYITTDLASTGTTLTVTGTPISTSILTATATATATSTSATSSRVNTGAIIGGIFGGLFAFLVFVYLCCYPGRKRRADVRSSPVEMVGVEPFVTSDHVPPALLGRALLRNQRPVVSLPSQAELRTKTNTSPMIGQTPTPPVAITTGPSAMGPSPNAHADLLEQVGMLWVEVSRLRHQQNRGSIVTATPSAPPPEYDP